MSQGIQTDTTDSDAAALELGDGSRLVLAAGAESPIVCRLEGTEHEIVDLELAQRLDGGQPFAGYQRFDA